MSFPPTLRAALQKRWTLSQQQGDVDASALLNIDQDICAQYETTVSPVVIDLAGFTSSAAQHGIIAHLSKIEMLRALLSPVIENNHGTLVKEEADNVFAFFPKPTQSLIAISAIFDTLGKHNDGLEDYAHIDISVGVGYGPTLVLPHDMWGTDFNFCCKLGEDLAKSNEVLVTADAKNMVEKGAFEFEEKAYVIGGMPMNAYRLIF